MIIMMIIIIQSMYFSQILVLDNIINNRTNMFLRISTTLQKTLSSLDKRFVAITLQLLFHINTFSLVQFAFDNTKLFYLENTSSLVVMMFIILLGFLLVGRGNNEILTTEIKRQIYLFSCAMILQRTEMDIFRYFFFC